MKEEHFGKPVIAIVNSFTQFVPGHAHLHDIGQYIKGLIEKEGYFAAEFNTIAIDDGIAMGHDGMLYSLPSRDIIADSVEYMCNGHKVDAMVCISNCDKITPGMLMAAMRLNIPAVFVSGGPMEAGEVGDKYLDLVDAMVMAADDSVSDSYLTEVEQNACPTCGSCSGMFTANSMNCLAEAIGLALPGNGTIVATHANRKKLFEEAVEKIITATKSYYYQGNESVLPRSIASKEAFENAMKVDIAMGGSTNTILHLLAIAVEAEVDFRFDDIDRLSRIIPNVCKVSPNSHFRIEDVHRAGGIPAVVSELLTAGLLDTDVVRADHLSLQEYANSYNRKRNTNSEDACDIFMAAPGRKGVDNSFASQNSFYDSIDNDRITGCIRNIDNAWSKDGGLAILKGNLAPDGCVVKTAGVNEKLLNFTGTAIVFDSQDDACEAILNDLVKEGQIVVIRYEGPAGGPGMQEMLYPTSYLKSKGLAEKCALITDGRFSGGSSGLSIGHISPEAAAGGPLALVKDGDIISIDIPARSISIKLSKEEYSERTLAERLKGQKAYIARRSRNVPESLKLYAMHVSSADKGAVRILNK